MGATCSAAQRPRIVQIVRKMMAIIKLSSVRDMTCSSRDFLSASHSSSRVHFGLSRLSNLTTYVHTVRNKQGIRASLYTQNSTFIDILEVSLQKILLV